jgi:Ca2+-binding RTX toxin-like protein
VLLAGAGDNTLNGGAGNDVLVAGAGNDSLHGGDGNDLLIAGPGNDLLDGGQGIDTVSFAKAAAGVVVDLGNVGAQNTGGAGVDTLTSIENLIGSDYNDTLIGNGGDNVLNGGAGNDVLKGGGGNDTLIGGPGDDTLTGGSGNDTFVWQKGDSGHDTVTDFTRAPIASICRSCCRARTPPAPRWMTTCTSRSAARAATWCRPSR